MNNSDSRIIGKLLPKQWSIFFVLVSFSIISKSDDSIELVSSLKDYKTVSGVSGNLTTAGSDSLANLMSLWTEDFKRYYPNVNIQVQASGSSTAPPALVQGTANIGAMSRAMKRSEIIAFENKYGYPPLAIPVAIDAMAIYVHKDNSIQGLTIDQLDAIFSVTRKCRFPTSIDYWSDLGIDGLGKIELFGRNSVSGTYGYFKSEAMCKGDFKKKVNEQLGSAAVVQSVSQSTNGIGYSGIGYFGAGVRVAPLSLDDSDAFVYPTLNNVLEGRYPLSRYMYIYVNKPPNQNLKPLEKEFLKLVLSKSGQQAVIKDGYIPLPEERINKILKNL